MKTLEIKIVFWYLLAYLIAVSAFVIIFKPPYIFSILLFFIVPAVYFSFLNKENILKVLFFSLIYGFVVSLIVDYFGVKFNYWEVPQTIFPFRVFTVIPIEDFIWGISGTFSSIMFYKTMFDKKKYKVNTSRLLLFFSFLFLMLIGFYLVLIKEIHISYFFMIGGSLLFLPSIIFAAIVSPAIFRNFRITFFVYILFILFEATSIYVHHWIFNESAQVIGWLPIFALRIPFEEILFFLIIGPIGNVIMYKFFCEKLP